MMEQREKLIELLVNPHKTDECLGGWCSNECKYFDCGDYCKTEMVADYLIANGVVVLPCKVGDTVYAINNGAIVEAKCYSIIAETEDDHFAFILTCKLSPTLDPCSSYFVKKFFGKTVFLTREEAERTLEKRKGGD